MSKVTLTKANITRISTTLHKKVKDSWNKEEVVILLNEWKDEIIRVLIEEAKGNKPDINTDKWIEENL